jgi:hypothetical protein
VRALGGAKSTMRKGSNEFCGRQFTAVSAFVGHIASNGEKILEMPIPGLSVSLPVYTSTNQEFPGPLILKRDFNLALNFEFGERFGTRGRAQRHQIFSSYFNTLPQDVYIGVIFQDCSGITVNEIAFTAEICEHIVSKAHLDIKRRFPCKASRINIVF